MTTTQTKSKPRPKPEPGPSSIDALRYSIQRLRGLLNAWEQGTSRGTYYEAREEVLAELTTAQRYLHDALNRCDAETVHRITNNKTANGIVQLEKILHGLCRRVWELNIE